MIFSSTNTVLCPHIFTSLSVSLPFRQDNYMVVQTKNEKRNNGLLLCVPFSLQQVYFQKTVMVTPERENPALVFAWMQRFFFYCMQDTKIAAHAPCSINTGKYAGWVCSVSSCPEPGLKQSKSPEKKHPLSSIKLNNKCN